HNGRAARCGARSAPPEDRWAATTPGPRVLSRRLARVRDLGRHRAAPAAPARLAQAADADVVPDFGWAGPGSDFVRTSSSTGVSPGRRPGRLIRPRDAAGLCMHRVGYVAPSPAASGVRLRRAADCRGGPAVHLG